MNIKFEIESKKAIKLEVQEINYSEISDNEEKQDLLLKEVCQLTAKYIEIKRVADMRHDDIEGYITDNGKNLILISSLRGVNKKLTKQIKKLKDDKQK